MILQSALAYRSYNQGVYGLELPIIRPWTSTPTVIDITTEFFEATTKLVESPATAAEPSESRTQAKHQMPDLAEILFAAYWEQVEWLGSSMAASDAVNERDRADMEERFKQARPVILEALRTSDLIVVYLGSHSRASCNSRQAAMDMPNTRSGSLRNIATSAAWLLSATKRQCTLPKRTHMRDESRRISTNSKRTLPTSCSNGISNTVSFHG